MSRFFFRVTDLMYEGYLKTRLVLQIKYDAIILTPPFSETPRKFSNFKNKHIGEKSRDYVNDVIFSLVLSVTIRKSNFTCQFDSSVNFSRKLQKLINVFKKKIYSFVVYEKPKKYSSVIIR